MLRTSKKIRSYLERFQRDEGGNVAMLIGIMIVVIVAMAAMAMDGMHAFTKKEQMRTAAETSALAAVNYISDRDDAKRIGAAFGMLNLPSLAKGTIVAPSDIEFGFWDEDAKTFDASGNPVNAVRATASMTAAKNNGMQTFFGAMLGKPQMDVSAEAVVYAGGSSPCIIALNGSENKSIEVNSNATINTPNCEMHARSNDNEAHYTDSNSSVLTKRTCIKGGYGECSNSSNTPEPEENCDPSDDPLAGLQPPTYGGCNHNGKELDDANTTLNPGVYCDGLTIKNNSRVTFNSGIYIIKDKKFFVDSNSKVNGTEVSFYLTGDDGLLEFNSNTEVSFTAPTTGPMKGVLFFQDRRYDGTHKFDSNVAAEVEGAFYFAKGRWESNSNTTMAGTSDCFMLIADTIYFDSNAGIAMTTDLENCPILSQLAGSGAPRLVSSK
ncbi:MAG: TadG family pilus assembly protein [Hyphomicrobiales bacterium]